MLALVIWSDILLFLGKKLSQKRFSLLCVDFHLFWCLFWMIVAIQDSENYTPSSINVLDEQRTAVKAFVVLHQGETKHCRWYSWASSRFQSRLSMSHCRPSSSPRWPAFSSFSIRQQEFSSSGTSSTHWILVIFTLTSLTYGMVESINRILPRDLIGGQIQKWQKIDATAGAFVTDFTLIPRSGKKNAFIITLVSILVILTIFHTQICEYLTYQDLGWLFVRSLKDLTTRYHIIRV